MRTDGRAADQIRPLQFERAFTEHPGGSVLVRWGRTVVLCTASLEDGVPPFLLNSGKGWLTAEYSMLPGATKGRRSRDVTKGRPDGRVVEIQRLIGRSLRAAVDFTRFAGRTLWLDCDVLQADGGTRTAAINGAWLALRDAFTRALGQGEVFADPVSAQVAAVSVGVCGGAAQLDLCAAEDQGADVDMNLVMTGAGEFIEVQGSAEKGTFGGPMLERLLELGRRGIADVCCAQQAALAESP